MPRREVSPTSRPAEASHARARDTSEGRAPKRAAYCSGVSHWRKLGEPGSSCAARSASRSRTCAADGLKTRARFSRRISGLSGPTSSSGRASGCTARASLTPSGGADPQPPDAAAIVTTTAASPACAMRCTRDRVMGRALRDVAVRTLPGHLPRAMSLRARVRTTNHARLQNGRKYTACSSTAKAMSTARTPSVRR